MSHQFKAGDLAVIVGCHRDPRNIGMTCELVRWVSAGDEYELRPGVWLGCPGDAWLIEGQHIIGGYHDGFTGKIFDVKGTAIADSKHLMPLRGDFTPEQQKTQAVSV